MTPGQKAIAGVFLLVVITYILGIVVDINNTQVKAKKAAEAEKIERKPSIFGSEEDARMKEYDDLKKSPEYPIITKIAIKYTESKIKDCFSLNLDKSKNGWARCGIKSISANHHDKGSYTLFLKQEKGKWKPVVFMSDDPFNGDYDKLLNACIYEDKIPCFIMLGFNDKECKEIDEFKAKKKQAEREK